MNSRAIARRVLDRIPMLEKGVISPLRIERRKRQVRALARHGLVDVDYVALQAPVPVSSARDAIRFLATAPNHYAPHALIEPRWVSSRVKGRDWLATLLDPAVPPISVGPLFDLAGVPEAERLGAPAEVIGRFLRAASTGTVLPLPVGTRGPVTLSDARADAFRFAEERAATADWVAVRGSLEWDAEAERRYIETHHGEADRWLDLPHDRPAVSIVMPVFNRENVVATAIDSVVAQTFPGWELVVVDDGSTDSTADVVRTYAARDERIRLVQGAHAGVSAARNLGIRESRGDVLAFIDSDNTWTPHLLALSLDEILSDRAELVYSAIEIDEGGEKPRYLGMTGTAEHLLHGSSFIDQNTLVVRKSLVEEVGAFDESLRRWVDFDLFIRLFRRTERISYLPFIGVRYDHRGDALDRITTSESPHWREIVLQKYILGDYAKSAPERVDGRVSVIVTTVGEWEWPVRAVDAVLANADDIDVEVVLVVSGSQREVPAILAMRYAHDPRVTVVVRRGRVKRPVANNIGFAASSGGTVVFLERTVEVRPGWLRPLLDDLEDERVFAVQPIPVGPGGAARHAGIVFGGAGVLPVRYLPEHPVEDVLASGQRTFEAVGDGVIAVRAAAFAAVGGYDPTFQGAFEDVDLCLRATRELGTINVLVPESRVFFQQERGRVVRAGRLQNARRFEERWGQTLPDEIDSRYAAAGFDVVERRELDDGEGSEGVVTESLPADLELVLARSERLVADGPFAGKPSLRWAIRIASPAEPRGDNWGDTFFAAEMKSALERLGQEVVVDRTSRRVRATSGLDDVVLTIRGLAGARVQEGAVNVLWVISHPDRVAAAEVVSQDLVYAASERWAHDASERFGRPVTPLLQATDPELFDPARATPGSGHDVLFVGTTRKLYRPIVRWAREAGAHPAIYGHGWEEFLPVEEIAGQSMPRAEAGAAYRAAGVVLNDHWEDMASEGFLSNRLFDGVAAGARMISDSAVGMEDVFGDVVTVVGSTEEMAHALATVRERVSEDDLMTASRRIREQHSFAARARTLIEDVYAWRESRGPSAP